MNSFNYGPDRDDGGGVGGAPARREYTPEEKEALRKMNEESEALRKAQRAILEEHGPFETEEVAELLRKRNSCHLCKVEGVECPGGKVWDDICQTHSSPVALANVILNCMGEDAIASLYCPDGKKERW